MLAQCHTFSVLFFFRDTAPTEIYTLSLHDALPISVRVVDERRAARSHRLTTVDLGHRHPAPGKPAANPFHHVLVEVERQDRKSTRLNSSHSQISYAVFCLKKKKNKNYNQIIPNIII